MVMLEVTDCSTEFVLIPTATPDKSDTTTLAGYDIMAVN